MLQKDNVPTPELDPAAVVIPKDASRQDLELSIPDQQSLLICIGLDSGPAQELASHLHNQGYQHVFTPETDWDGAAAITHTGNHDRT